MGGDCVYVEWEWECVCVWGGGGGGGGGRIDLDVTIFSYFKRIQLKLDIWVGMLSLHLQQFLFIKIIVSKWQQNFVFNLHSELMSF